MKAVVWAIRGIRPKMRRPESSASPTAPPPSCGCLGGCTSLGQTIILFASTRMPEPRPGCCILAYRSRRMENPHGRVILLLNGKAALAEERVEVVELLAAV